MPLGLLLTGGADGLAYDIALAGAILVLTTGEWDAVVGTSGGLDSGKKYYLSDVVGRLLETSGPASAGDTLVVVGNGLSSTQLLVSMDHEGLVV